MGRVRSSVGLQGEGKAGSRQKLAKMPSKGDWIKPDGDSAWTEELQCATDIEFGKAHELNAHSLLSVVYALSITRHCCRRSLSACLCESSHSVRHRSRPDSLHQRSGGKRRWTIRCAAYRGNYSDKLRGERARQRYTRTIHDSMKVSRSRLHFCEERQRRTLTPVTP